MAIDLLGVVPRLAAVRRAIGRGVLHDPIMLMPADGSRRPTLLAVTYRAVRPEDFEWITRPHDPGEPARHVAELSDQAGFAHVRGNVWRYEPGAKGKRHRHPIQEETFVVLEGELTMYLGEPPERVDVPTGGVVNVPAGTPLQSANHGAVDLLVYAYGYPPEDTTAELLEPAV